MNFGIYFDILLGMVVYLKCSESEVWEGISKTFKASRRVYELVALVSMDLSTL